MGDPAEEEIGAAFDKATGKELELVQIQGAVLVGVELFQGCLNLRPRRRILPPCPSYA